MCESCLVRGPGSQRKPWPNTPPGEAQFTAAARFVNLPDDLKAFMMEEQGGLSKQNLQNLRVLTGGASNFSSVVRALQVLGVDDEPLLKANSSGRTYLTNREVPADYTISHDETFDSEDDEVPDETEINAWTRSMALNYLADWEEKRRRTWAENNALKKAQKKDRRHFETPSSRPPRPPQHKGPLHTAQLKAITRCARCGMKGHWKEECTNPYKAKGEKSQTSKVAGGSPSAFVFLGMSAVSKDDGSYAGWGSYFNFLEIPPGYAIVDPGASQDLIGYKSYQRLRSELAKHGLKAVRLEQPPPPATGIGGQAKPLFLALAPCFSGGHPGVVRVTVIEEDVPHLLSLGLLEHTKSVIDTENNKIHFSALMKLLESGHRVLSVTEGAKQFEVPPQVLAEYGLSPDSFHFNDSERGVAYMAADGFPNIFHVFDDQFHIFVQWALEASTCKLGHGDLLGSEKGFDWVTTGIVNADTYQFLQVNAHTPGPKQTKTKQTDRIQMSQGLSSRLHLMSLVWFTFFPRTLLLRFQLKQVAGFWTHTAVWKRDRPPKLGYSTADPCSDF